MYQILNLTRLLVCAGVANAVVVMASNVVVSLQAAQKVVAHIALLDIGVAVTERCDNIAETAAMTGACVLLGNRYEGWQIMVAKVMDVRANAGRGAHRKRVRVMLLLQLLLLLVLLVVLVV